MVAGEGAGGDVRSDYVGEDIRWSHPDALRAAVLTANGIHARARWETKQGIDYSTFRFALKDASGGKLRRAPEPFDGAPEPSPSASISFSASDDPRRDAGRHSPASARTRYGFAPALVALVGASEPAALPDRRRLKEMIRERDKRVTDGFDTTARIDASDASAGSSDSDDSDSDDDDDDATEKSLGGVSRATVAVKAEALLRRFAFLPEPLRAADIDSRALRHDASRDNTPLDAIDHATKTKTFDRTRVDEARCAAARLPPIVAAAAARHAQVDFLLKTASWHAGLARGASVAAPDARAERRARGALEYVLHELGETEALERVLAFEEEDAATER